MRISVRNSKDRRKQTENSSTLIQKKSHLTTIFCVELSNIDFSYNFYYYYFFIFVFNVKIKKKLLFQFYFSFFAILMVEWSSNTNEKFKK